MFFIETQRLKLIPLTHLQLQLLAQNRQEMERSIGLQPSAMIIDSAYQTEITDALNNFWLPKTAEFPDNFEWYTSWEIVLKALNTTIGGIGFIGLPNEKGETEAGFMIDQRHHRHGYALEALSAMINWAFKHKGTTSVLAQTEPGNLSSRQLLLKAGFQMISEETDRIVFRITGPIAGPTRNRTD